MSILLTMNRHVLRPLLLLCVLLPFEAVAAEEVPGRVVGCLEVGAGVAPAGVASLWDATTGRIPDPRRYIIIPTAVASLQSDGCFALQAPPGNYYVGGVLRLTPGPSMGPPRSGDRVFMTPAPDGSSLVVAFAAGALVDVGLRSDSWLYNGFTSEIETGLRGRVLDATGQPVAGLLVFAFSDPEMTGSPLAVSDRTTMEGRFQLRLDSAGVVFLRVKESYGGGAPSPGGYVGVFGGDTPGPVVIRAGKVVGGLEVRVVRVPAEMLKRGKLLPIKP